MRYTHVYTIKGDYIDCKGRSCQVVNQDNPGVNVGLGVHSLGRNPSQVISKPWLNSDSEAHYAVDNHLMPQVEGGPISSYVKTLTKASVMAIRTIADEPRMIRT